MLSDKLNSFFKSNFHSLYHRNYRYFFFGQLISLVGTWMQIMAQAWLVYMITNSPFKLGLVSAIQFLPTLVFSLFIGVLIDKYAKKKILLITQTLYLVQALVLFVLVYTGVVEYWHVVILTFFLGCVTAVDMPARQAYVIELVGREDVVNAVGLNSAIYNLARIVGPAIAGILMTGLGIEWCFFINGISFITVILGLFMITNDGCGVLCKNSKSLKDSMIKDIKEGLTYIYKNPILLKTSLIILFITVISFNYNVLIPVFAKTVLGLKERGFGVLLSSLGVGSLIGALLVSTRGRKDPKTKSLVTSALFIGVSLFLLSFSKNIYISAAILVACGISNLWFFTNANSILQLNSDDQHRGRVMSVYSMVFSGATPIGSFLTGISVEKIGADTTFLFIGVVIITVIISIQAIRGSIRP